MTTPGLRVEIVEMTEQQNQSMPVWPPLVWALNSPLLLLPRPVPFGNVKFGIEFAPRFSAVRRGVLTPCSAACCCSANTRLMDLMRRSGRLARIRSRRPGKELAHPKPRPPDFTGALRKMKMKRERKKKDERLKKKRGRNGK